ncbi:MAG: chemotaxis-specific protein-glutamate methyltransferase CheB [Rhodospirillaceae bacterium]|jgi:two-component system, chemotaxis family, protein-glutamate methylesterase/glutaminase|nr:chemotaxis-specific protein-glutamate methyltransferase CheB [Rhodospirillaceae bacterium]
MSVAQREIEIATKAGEPIRVMIVADPGFVGDKVRGIVEADPRLTLVAQVVDGVSAVSALRRQVIDAVVLDIGQTEAQIKVTLSRMFRLDPHLKVLMVGSLSFTNVKISMMGLMEGAAEFLVTPSSHSKRTEKDFTDGLTSVLMAFGRSTREVEGRHTTLHRDLPQPRPKRELSKPISLRPASTKAPQILAFGSSTGGPQALFSVLALLPSSLKLPVVITQHMPATFTALLAGHINKHSALPCAEGKHGEPLLPGHIYLAPGDHHMTVCKGPNGPEIAIDQSPPVNFCRPAVDPLFASLVDIYGGNILATMLTGMGADGLNGSRSIVEAGGTLIAQDEESSVVWGMPGAVAKDGICAAVLPLDEIAPFINQTLKQDW